MLKQMCFPLQQRPSKSIFFFSLQKTSFHHILTVVFLSRADGPCGISKTTRAKAGQKTCALFPSLTQWRTFGRKWSLPIRLHWHYCVTGRSFQTGCISSNCVCLSPVIHVETSMDALKLKHVCCNLIENSAVLLLLDTDNWNLVNRNCGGIGTTLVKPQCVRVRWRFKFLFKAKKGRLTKRCDQKPFLSWNSRSRWGWWALLSIVNCGLSRQGS